MKALTLWQPWATLVALGHKTVETRSWETSYRGPLAIHAARRVPRDWPGPHVLVGNPTRGYALAGDDYRWPLPLGVIVATCRLVDVVPTHRTSPPSYQELDYGDLPSKGWDRAVPEFDEGDDTVLVSGHNRMLGDFGPGRFAWLLDDIEPVEPPIRARGRQQLWEWRETIAC